MKTILAIVLSIGLFAAAGYAQPTITQVSNAGSFSLAPLPNSSIAQGSFFAIFGSNLGPATSACGANLKDCIWSPYPLPTTLPATNGSSVKVTVGGTSVDAYLYFATAGQINAVLPSSTPTGSGQVTVTYNGQTSAPFSINVTASTFGAFAINQAGTGPGVITDASGNVITPTHPAKPGDTVILWGTGLGPVPASDVANEGTAPPKPTDMTSAQSVKVWIGNELATVAYAGRSGYTAEDQVNVVVPQSALGCYVNVALQSGSTPTISNFTSMAVDPSGTTCSDTDGINIADISSKLQSSGSANVGVVSMLSNFLNITGVLPLQWDNDTVNAEIGTFSSSTLDAFQGFTLAPSVNNCTVSPFQGFPPAKDPALAGVTFLDAGSALSIQGPNGTKSVPKNSDGKGYGALVGGETIQDLISGCPSGQNCNPYFLDSKFNIVSGNYTVTGPGGSNVGQVSGTISVSSAAASFKWTNPPASGSTPIPRNQDLKITWTGGDPNGFVDITAIGSTATAVGGPTPTTPGILIECIAPGNAGSFTIPAWVLQALPSTAGSQSIVPPGEILVGPASGGVKISPTPSGLDAAYLFYHYISGTTVTWQ
jgi:uncharacterized protein (TIGR03437 family)